MALLRVALSTFEMDSRESIDPVADFFAAAALFGLLIAGLWIGAGVAG